MQNNYDLIVIGAGQAGDPLVRAFAAHGKRVALIEARHVGGTCVNEGCTPTKTMIASARVAHLARRAGDYGVATGPISIDLSTVRERKRKIVEEFRTGTEKTLQQTEGVDLIYGHGAFTDAHTVAVTLADGTMQSLTAETIAINTGVRNAIPPVTGLSEVPHFGNQSLMELKSVPEHLIVLGGGYIALEFGQMFHRFGSRVTIVQQGKQVLEHEDIDVAEEIVTILRDEGMEIRLECQATAVSQTNSGEIALVVTSQTGQDTLIGTHLLVATGRIPNTDTLGLDKAGIATDDHGYITVSDRLETNVSGIYALGDVKGGPAFTHISYDDFRILRANLLEGGIRTTKDRLVPYTVFIDPQLGRVGLTEREARAQSKQFRVAKLPMSEVARAIETEETHGFMKALVDLETDQILGCAFLAPEGGETMAVLQMAMIGKMPWTALRDGVFAHPTYAEALNNLFMTLDK